ncbi:MAG: hypothetical protein K9L88_16155 [Chromatiaceae bacterium]|nr:hypothetical protein [Chromatiaceae bacterium]
MRHSEFGFLDGRIARILDHLQARVRVRAISGHDDGDRPVAIRESTASHGCKEWPP